MAARVHFRANQPSKKHPALRGRHAEVEPVVATATTAMVIVAGAGDRRVLVVDAGVDAAGPGAGAAGLERR